MFAPSCPYVHGSWSFCDRRDSSGSRAFLPHPSIQGGRSLAPEHGGFRCRISLCPHRILPGMGRTRRGCLFAETCTDRPAYRAPCTSCMIFCAAFPCAGPFRSVSGLFHHLLDRALGDLLAGIFHALLRGIGYSRPHDDPSDDGQDQDHASSSSSEALAIRSNNSSSTSSEGRASSVKWATT